MAWPIESDSNLTYPKPRPLLHGAIWTVLALVYFLAVYPFQPAELFWQLAEFKAIWGLTGFGFTSAIAWLYRRIRLLSAPLPEAAAAAGVVSTLTGLAWVGLLAWIARLATGSSDVFVTRSSLPFVAVNHLSILAAWSGGYLAFSYWRRARLEETRTARAEMMARDAQLRMLRYQLDPHFLFNSLASLRALISEDPGRARDMVGKLSGFLRYSLAMDDRLWSTVGEEVDVIRGYLEIERVRFEERLFVQIDLDPATAGIRVPSFILHGLVENAVKHGKEDGEGTLRISVSTQPTELGARMTVCNTGRLSAGRQTAGGIGVENVRARLTESYGTDAAFDLTEDDGWVCAVITVPSRPAFAEENP